MDFCYCPTCGKNTGHKRALGWGTFFAVIITGGFWILDIPFYPKRCIVCGSEMRGEKKKENWEKKLERKAEEVYRKSKF